MTRRVADIVAETLAAHGVEYAFGIPGGEVVTFIDALEAAGIKFILTRHETPAAIMAAGVSAATNCKSPGLLVTTVGPGLTNAINGIADAAQEHCPLIVISGVVDHDIRARYTHQVIDQSQVLAPLVKASFEVESAGAGRTIARAIAIATSHPMGPVHIDLAPGTAALPSDDADRIAKPAWRQFPTLRDGDDGIEKLAHKLSQAKHPLIVAGLDAVRELGPGQITELAEQLNSPVITTYKAKGLIDEHHDLSLGGAGLSPLCDKILMPLVAKADVVLAVGYDPIEMRQGWSDPFSENAFVASLGPLIADHGMHHVDLHLIAHTGSILSALMKSYDKRQGGQKNKTWPGQDIANAKAKLSSAFAEPSSWGPHTVFSVLSDTLPDDAVVTVDSGAHRILLSQMVRFRAPNQLLQSAGFCTMGAAVPLAAGAKVAARENAAIAVLGDGGLEMGLGELATLRDQALPIIVLVLQDRSLALIELKQRQAGLKEAGVKLGATRFEDVATAMGGYGLRVASRSELESALKRAYNADAFTVIVAEIEAEAYAGKI